MAEMTFDIELPRIGKNEMRLLEALEGNDTECEREAELWTQFFIAEVDRIESFFKKNLRELK